MAQPVRLNNLLADNLPRLISLLIILLAFALRWHNLTDHSLWFDEAMSVHWAKQNVAKIIEVGFTLQEDRLPPLYYLMLKGWSHVFGLTEAGIRSLSVFMGVLLVPVTLNLAQRLFNRRVAWLAGLLVAVNPFLIWYSQEARMYAPAVLFGTLTIRSYLSVISHTHRRPPKKPAYPKLALHTVSFISLALLALYSHLYAGFLLPALGLWLLLAYPRRPRLWLHCLLSGVLIVLAYTPILRAIWQFSGEALPGHPWNGLIHRGGWLLQAFMVWQAPLSNPLQSAILISTVIVTLCAYLPVPPLTGLSNRSPSYRSPILLITLLLITPFLVATLLLYRNHHAFFGARYFIIMLPWLMLLMAVGLDKISHFTATLIPHRPPMTDLLLPTAYLLLITLALPGQWSIPASKEAWRQTVSYLAEQAKPTHGILIHPDWVRYPFQFYFRGPGQTYAAFSDVTAETNLDGPLEGVVRNHPVIWLIQSHLNGPDPQRQVEQWFTTRYPLVTELYPPGISLKAYAPGYQLDRLPPAAIPIDWQFENGLHLLGYQADDTASARDELFHPPSGWLHVTLYWTAYQPVAEDVRPIVELSNMAGVWGISLNRSTDALGLYPTSRWPVGQIIRHDVDVNLNPATPAGSYHLTVKLSADSAATPLTQLQIR